MVDSFRHQGMRKQLVEELKGKGIKDQNVLENYHLAAAFLLMKSNPDFDIFFRFDREEYRNSFRVRA